MEHDEAIEVIRAVERRCMGLMPLEARTRVVAFLQTGDLDSARALNRAARSACCTASR